MGESLSWGGGRALCGHPSDLFPSSQSASVSDASVERLLLKAVVGYNGNGRANVVWKPDTGGGAPCSQPRSRREGRSSVRP